MYILAQSNGAGCQTCTTGYQLVNMLNSGTASDHSLDICGVSNYVQTTAFNTDNALKYCTQFGKKTGAEVIGCFACKTGYVVKSDKSGCLVNTAIPNCALADAADNCLTCNSGYNLYLSSGKQQCGNASTFTIVNCNTHFSNSDTTVTDYLKV